MFLISDFCNFIHKVDNFCILAYNQLQNSIKNKGLIKMKIRKLLAIWAAKAAGAGCKMMDVRV